MNCETANAIIRNDPTFSESHWLFYQILRQADLSAQQQLDAEEWFFAALAAAFVCGHYFKH